jgi:hypothetical protein
MKTVKMIVISMLTSAVSLAAVASQAWEPDREGSIPESMPMMPGGMPMMQDQQGGMPMMQGQQGGMPMMQMMQLRHAMMDEHMRKMEMQLSNIESFHKQLVELQKK